MQSESLHEFGVEDEALLELKGELATVVEALGFLHDFIENTFGTKFQSFCEDHQHQRPVTEGGSRIDKGGDPREALRQLRWKHYNRETVGTRKRLHTVSSDFKKSSNEQDDDGPEASNRFSIVGHSEIVDVKMEANCEGEQVLPDFLEDVDVDPFYGEPETVNSYNYEADRSELNISSSRKHSKTLQSHHPSNDDTDEGTKSNNPSNCGQASRFIPGLIPIQPDPLKSEENDNDSGTGYSDSSDGDWHPTSSTTSSTAKRKSKKGVSTQPKKKTITIMQKRNFSSSSIESILLGKTAIHPVTKAHASTTPRYPQQSHNLTGEGGPFKCNLCPASYKQEDSLRSHQKYKHNPSRVQCQCPLCGKSMVDKYRLQRHLRLHTGEKPFECQFCGQSFYRKDYHTKHMQRKHGINSNSTHTAFSTSTSTSSSNSSLTGGKAVGGKKGSITIRPTHPVGSTSSGHYGRSAGSSQSGGRTKPTATTSSTSSSGQSILNPAINHVTITSSSSGSTTTSTSSGFIDYFSNLGAGGGTPTIVSASGNSLGLTDSGLVTMASLTFDDLISADL